MNVLLINGSPHENGCTWTALTEISDTLTQLGIESEIFHIGKDAIQGCTACGACSQTKECVFQDNVIKELTKKLENANALIIGSPVYFAGPNGSLCALLDRLFYAYGYLLTGKPGAAVVSCRRGGASATFDRLNKYFTIKQMPVVSSRYWNSVHGNTPEEVRKDLEGLQTMRILAQNMAWLLKGIATEKRPPQEPNIATSFADGK